MDREWIEAIAGGIALMMLLAMMIIGLPLIF